MTSKISLSKLVRNNCRRRAWLFFLTMLIGIIILPIAVLVSVRISTGVDVIGGSTLVKEAFFGWKVSPAQNAFLSTVTPINPILMMAILVDAFLSGVTGFAYMNKSNQTDFYHSLPVKRGKLFLTGYLGGALTSVVPFVICELLCVPLALVLGVGSGKVFLVMLVGVCSAIVAYLAVYAAVILAMMLTGRVFTGILMAIVLLMYLPCTLTMLHYGMVAWMPNIATVQYNPLEINVAMFSPASLLPQLTMMRMGEWWLCILLYAVVLSFLSWLIYVKRPTEVQGDTFLSPKMNPFIKVLVGVAGAFVSGMFFSALSEADDVLFMYIGTFAGVIVINFIMEFIYNPDLKVACSHWKSFMVFLAASAAVAVFFTADPFALNASLPAEAQVAEVGVANNETEAMIGYNNDYIEADQFRYAPMDDDLYETVGRMAGKSERTGRDGRNTCNLVFKMKDGSTVRRFYAADKEDVIDLVELVEKRGRDKVCALVQFEKYEWASITVEGWQVDSEDEDVVFALRDKGEALKKALEKDTATMTCRKADKEGCVCILTVSPDKKHESFQPPYMFPVYKSYENTLKVLEQTGVRLEANKENAILKLKNQVSSIEDDNSEKSRYCITDPEEIAKFMRGVSTRTDYEFTEDSEKMAYIRLNEKNGKTRYLRVRVDDPELLEEYRICDSEDA